MKVMFVLLTFALMATVVEAQWGVGSSAVCTNTWTPGEKHTWKPNDTNGDSCFELWQGKNYIGFWNGSKNYFRAWKGVGHEYGPFEDNAPAIPPLINQDLIAPASIQSWQKEGVFRDDRSKETTYSVSGQPVSLRQAVASLEDDSSKMWLTLIGDKATREGFLKSVPPELISKCRVWSCPQNHHSIVDRDTGKTMFPGDGFIVYLQDSRGNVLYRGNSIEALRKADPSFNPIPPKGPDTPGGTNNSILIPFITAIGGALLYTLIPKKAPETEQKE